VQLLPRNKSGTVTGLVSGSTMTLTLFLAAGVDGDPTPACTATMSGSLSGVGTEQLAGTYTGSDSCEGPFLNGRLAVARRH
jgi:hypothetical protein